MNKNWFLLAFPPFMALASCAPTINSEIPPQNATSTQKEATEPEIPKIPSTKAMALREAAERGDAAAQFKLGLAYAKGRGVEVDGHEAMRLWRSSAKLCAKRPPCRVLPPANFSCSNGTKFTIAFLTNKTDAYIFPITKQKAVEHLKNNKIGSGIEYANDRYIFHEHQDRVTLTKASGEAKPVPCVRAKEAGF